jgi:hypothetical protein
MTPPKQGDTQLSEAYFMEQYRLAQLLSQQIQQAEIALRELQRAVDTTRAFPGKVTGAGGQFNAYTVANGIYQIDPSPAAEGCSAINMPFGAIGVGNIPIASGTHCIMLKKFDGVSDRICAFPIANSSGTGMPFQALTMSTATGSFASGWHYGIKKVIGFDSSKPIYKNQRFITSGSPLLSAISGMDTISSTFPYTHALGVTITSAGGQVNSTSCHVKPYGPNAFVSVVPIRDKAIGNKIRNVIISAENSAQ